jgi:Holliday junction resolvasome RuvABC endonuclease subunit
VSLDLSKTRTGAAKWRNREPISTLSESFTGSGDTGALLAAFRSWLATLIAHDVEWVAFEDVRPVNKHHSEIHFGMVGVLAEMCYRRDIPLLRVTTPSMKKALIGKGRATKEEALAAARERYPRANAQNHDEAEALGVGLAACELIDWEGGSIEVKEPEYAPF